MDTYTPIAASDLTYEQKRKALYALFFLTKKINVDIKERKVADGSKKRTFEGYIKSDAASPTLSTDWLLITCAIDGYEICDVVVADMPGAFLNTDNPDYVLMCLRVKLAEMVVRVDPKLHRNYVMTSAKGEPILYVKLNKALYGLLKSDLLFYKKLVGELEGMGFKINIYDPCVANRMKICSQQTVMWHVDDLKISHVEPMVNTDFLLKLANIYGPGINLSRGKVHDYLGMDIYYSSRGKVKIP